MNKLIATIALAVVMALPVTWSLADDDFNHIIYGNQYTTYNGEHRIRIHGNNVRGGRCDMDEGERVRATRQHQPGTTYVEVLTGNCKGSIGYVNDLMLVQKIHTTGRWGNDVPVFKDQKSYFNARDHNNISADKVACRLRKNDYVLFEPYKDWGVGMVKASDGNCEGWIDRGVIR